MDTCKTTIFVNGKEARTFTSGLARAIMFCRRYIGSDHAGYEIVPQNPDRNNAATRYRPDIQDADVSRAEHSYV